MSAWVDALKEPCRAKKSGKQSRSVSEKRGKSVLGKRGQEREGETYGHRRESKLRRERGVQGSILRGGIDVGEGGEAEEVLIPGRREGKERRSRREKVEGDTATQKVSAPRSHLPNIPCYHLSYLHVASNGRVDGGDELPGLCDLDGWREDLELDLRNLGSDPEADGGHADGGEDGDDGVLATRGRGRAKR